MNTVLPLPTFSFVSPGSTVFPLLSLSPSKQRGSDRCRHFVITQNPAGQFVIAGDSQPHGSLGELIEHYRLSPIQPFGEHLTSSWSEVRGPRVGRLLAAAGLLASYAKFTVNLFVIDTICSDQNASNHDIRGPKRKNF